MNEFYSISPLNTQPENEYQLDNLGLRKIIFSGVKRNRDPWGPRTNERHTVFDDVTKDDYDGAFAFKLTQVNPPYAINKTIEYHLDFYVRNSGDKGTFLKHMKYVIVPYFKRHNYSETHLQLLNEWIEENEPNNKNKKMRDLNINGNNNIVNNAGRDIHQSGIAITVTENQYQQLKEFGIDENYISELKEIVSNHSQDKPTFKSKVLKWLSAVSVSLVTKGVVDHLPQINEFAHHLITSGSL